MDKARAALSPQTLAAATAAAAAADGVEILDPACEGTGNGLGSAAGPASAAGFEDRALSRKEEASLLHPLLRLRQACCHPQVRCALCFLHLGLCASGGAAMRHSFLCAMAPPLQ